jgi:hypothetical protein
MRISWISRISLLLLLFLLTPGDIRSEFIFLDRSVATVGGRVILDSDLTKYTCYVSMKEGKSISSVERRKLLDELVEEMIMEIEITRTGKIEADSSVLHGKIGEIKRNISGCEGVCTILCEDVSYPARRAMKEIESEEFIRKRIEPFVEVPEGDMFNFYLRNPTRFKAGYNDEVKEEIRVELNKKKVETELRRVITRVKRKLKVIIPEE